MVYVTDRKARPNKSHTQLPVFGHPRQQSNSLSEHKNLTRKMQDRVSKMCKLLPLISADQIHSILCDESNLTHGFQAASFGQLQ